MPIKSAGVLLYRKRKRKFEVFLIHPGGPFWQSKDEGAWSIPKGTITSDEDALCAAKREFKEETGFDVEGEFRPLGAFRQPGGKIVTAFAVEGNCDPVRLVSNTFSMMWPPRSGKFADFPEVDRGGWFAQGAAEAKILRGQRPLLEKFFASMAPPGLNRASRPAKESFQTIPGLSQAQRRHR
jgi:predicted NUDIX family NTP pyrophosphohydrolase